MRALVLHRLFLRAAVALVGIFAWIFFFQFFYVLTGDVASALTQTALLYALSAVVTCLATPFTARLLRSGARRSLVFSVLFLAIAYVAAGSFFEGFWQLEHLRFAIVSFALALGMYRALYWIPYKVEASTAPSRRPLWSEALIALAPALGGLFIAATPSAAMWLFYAGAALLGLSLVPLMRLHDVYENFEWGYRATFHELLAPEHRTLVTHAFVEGISGAALLFFWPLAVFLLFSWSYGVLGVTLSLTFLTAMFLRAPARALLRKGSLKKSRLLPAVLAVSPWLLRLTVASPFAVILVDSYFYTTTPHRLSVDPFVFEQVSDGGSLLDEYTALKEIALNAGRAVCAIAGASVALFISVPVALVFVFCSAAIVSVGLALQGR